MHCDLTNREELIGRVSLEVSLKPFWDDSDDAIRATALELFTQWMPLLRKASRAAVMLWTADGGELLEYRGRLTDTFEWAKWIGMADMRSLDEYDPAQYNLHAKAELYRPDPPERTYGDLKRIVAALREAGERITGLPIEIGTTFDPGGEFAQSDFKFGRHMEIAAHRLDGGICRWVTCTSSLHADSEAYAGFPNGIPEGTHIGTFLGRQAECFLRDMGMDFIWFSNGFAFAANAWSCTGALFDGETFDNANAPDMQAQILKFWRLFRAECPRYLIECRGSNLSTGMDLSAHGSPLREIYRGGFALSAPPNSPWAALDGNYGLELVGWLSHIAELPDSGQFPFRYYTHDPWWLNSPWFDRYGRAPHDIYLPLALSRINENGGTDKPTCINFLSADTSYGELPDRCPIDVTTHLVKALDDFPDAPGLLTWVYPFDEYHDFVKQNRLDEAFFGDWFITGAVNRGLPLTGVVSSRVLTQLTQPVFCHRVLIAPVPDADSPLEAALLQHIRRGASVLFYGPVAHASERLLAMLGLRRAIFPARADWHLRDILPKDSFDEGVVSDRLMHTPLVSGGPLDAAFVAGTGAECCAEAVAGDLRAAYATFRPAADPSGAVAWVRGSFNYELHKRLPRAYAPDEYAPSDALPRRMLARFGIGLRTLAPSVATRAPLMLGASRDGGWFFSGFQPSTNVEWQLRLPDGAPLLIGQETYLLNGAAAYRFPRAWHAECRVLVSGQTDGELSVNESYPLHTIFRRRLNVTGLRDATVVVLPETKCAQPLHVATGIDGGWMPRESLPYAVREDGACVLTHITGSLRLSW